MLTVILLTISNIFMNFAWYGHLKFKESPLWLAILASWLIALPEYCFQVPANRYGHGDGPGYFSASQLKIMQEAITLVVFATISVTYLGEKLRWNYILGFVLILAAVAVVFGIRPADEKGGGEAATASPATSMISGEEVGNVE